MWVKSKISDICARSNNKLESFLTYKNRFMIFVSLYIAFAGIPDQLVLSEINFSYCVAGLNLKWQPFVQGEIISQLVRDLCLNHGILRYTFMMISN